MFRGHVLEPGKVYTSDLGIGFSPIEIFIWYIKSYQHCHQLDNYEILEQFNLQHSALENAFLTCVYPFNNKNIKFQLPISKDETDVANTNIELFKFTRHFFEEHQRVLDAIDQVEQEANEQARKRKLQLIPRIKPHTYHISYQYNQTLQPIAKLLIQALQNFPKYNDPTWQQVEEEEDKPLALEKPPKRPKHYHEHEQNGVLNPTNTPLFDNRAYTLPDNINRTMDNSIVGRQARGQHHWDKQWLRPIITGQQQQ
jgi:hypothetical protein